MKIDLEIDEKVPQDVRAIIDRADYYINFFPVSQRNQLSLTISQMIQQAYFNGCMDGSTRTHKEYTDILKSLGKADTAVQP